MVNSTVPIVNPHVPYINGMQVAYTSTTTLTVSAGQASNINNNNDLYLSADTVLNAATNGANGLDQGSLANATFYYVFVINSTTDVTLESVLLSTSATDPLLPKDYDLFQVIASGMLTDSSAHFLPFIRTGNGSVRKHTYNTLISVLSAGHATSFTNVDLTAAVPLGNVNVYLQATITPNTAANQLKLCTNGSTATNGNVQISGVVASVAQTIPVSIQCDEDGLIQYLLSNSADTGVLAVAGYDDILLV